LGFKFEKQWIYGKRFVADAYLPEYNTIVQFDGDYWHGNQKKYSLLSEFQKSAIINDAKANSCAESQGLRILRIWESDIKSDDIKENISDFFKEIEKFPGA
jgi:very-short-patch-repair endonuclease